MLVDEWKNAGVDAELIQTLWVLHVKLMKNVLSKSFVSAIMRDVSLGFGMYNLSIENGNCPYRFPLLVCR